MDMRPSADGIGQFERDGLIWPAYALSPDLNPLADRPETYRIAVLMGNGREAYGLLCQQVALIGRGQLAPHPLPPAMRDRDSPLRALALHEGEMRYLSSAAALHRLIRQRLGFCRSP